MTKSTEELNKNVLVTGGSGFLGSHVADALTEAGYMVTIFDREQSPYLKMDQKMYVGDILNMDQVLGAVDGKSAVFHFAGLADIAETNQKPSEAIKYNILGTANFLDSCVKANVSRFVFASTVYVYSEHGGFYRSTKQACELLIENYKKSFNLCYTTIRFGSIYGRRANSFNWIHKIIHQALTDGVMDRQGNGEEIRDYIHVLDAAKACVSILDEKYKNIYILLAGSQTIKVKDLMKMISEMLDNKIKLRFKEGKLEEHYDLTPYSFRPRIAKKLNQETQMDLGQGILDTIYDVYKEIYPNQELNTNLIKDAIKTNQYLKE